MKLIAVLTFLFSLSAHGMSCEDLTSPPDSPRELWDMSAFIKVMPINTVPTNPEIYSFRSAKYLVTESKGRLHFFEIVGYGGTALVTFDVAAGVKKVVPSMEYDSAVLFFDESAGEVFLGLNLRGDSTMHRVNFRVERGPGRTVALKWAAYYRTSPDRKFDHNVVGR